MEEMTIVLQQHTQETPGIKEALEAYEEIEAVYRKSLEAMGWIEPNTPQVENTADITLSFREPVDPFAM